MAHHTLVKSECLAAILLLRVGCLRRAVASISENETLFNLIAHYGGDGQSTFALPISGEDCRFTSERLHSG